MITAFVYKQASLGVNRSHDPPWIFYRFRLAFTRIMNSTLPNQSACVSHFSKSFALSVRPQSIDWVKFSLPVLSRSPTAKDRPSVVSCVVKKTWPAVTQSSSLPEWVSRRPNVPCAELRRAWSVPAASGSCTAARNTRRSTGSASTRTSALSLMRWNYRAVVVRSPKSYAGTIRNW